MGFALMCRCEDFHPFECDGHGRCVHCDRRTTTAHDPAVCALCDPTYDLQPNPARETKDAEPSGKQAA